MISGAASAGLDFVEIPPLDPETVELTAALGSSVLTGCLYMQAEHELFEQPG